MMKNLIQPGMAFADGTEYSADTKLMHVYGPDCAVVTDPVYYSCCGWGNHELRTAFYLRGKKNVTPDFNGAVLRLHGDLTIEDCRFRGDRGYIRICPEFEVTETAPYYHRNITVRGCSFDRECALEAYAADNIRIGGCRAAGKTGPEYRFTKCGAVCMEG